MKITGHMVAKYINACRALKHECRDADELLRMLRLDPEIYRTEGGYINIPKVKAALANPDDYPMMPNERGQGEPACGRSPAPTGCTSGGDD